MAKFVVRNNRKLRTGITTGTCAAAAAKAACFRLLRGVECSSVCIDVGRDEPLTVKVLRTVCHDQAVTGSVIKDAGDDPDVTDGLEICATVAKSESGITIDGGEGVGRVTKPGLKIPVGRAAINPMPLEMIEREVSNTCRECGYDGGLQIIVSVPRGEEIAKKTMNERLGIVGGVSILGTTGIVEPMSERAIIETIKAEMNMHPVSGREPLIVTPGNYGREFARIELGLDIAHAVKCSNFIGEMLDHAVFLGLKRITLIGHAGKLIKLAGGIMNTHSRYADGRMEILAAHAALCGATRDVVQVVMECVTVEAAIEQLRTQPFYDAMRQSIARKTAFYINARTRNELAVEVIVFTLENGVFIHTDTKNS